MFQNSVVEGEGPQYTVKPSPFSVPSSNFISYLEDDIVGMLYHATVLGKSSSVEAG